MRRFTSLIAFAGLLVGLLGSAHARRGDANAARDQVRAYYQKRGLNSEGLRVHDIGSSKSGKSARLAIATGDKVKVVNYLRGTKKVSATRTGLITQERAQQNASAQIKNYQEHLRTRATFTPAGLSTRGDSYKFAGKSGLKGEVTFDAYVTLRQGRLNNVAIGNWQ
jgi:hypothetical protein